MPQTNTITGELRAMQAGIERARSATAAIDSEAERVAARTVAAGFVAIAAALAQVRDGIREIMNRLGGVDGLLGEAVAALAAAPEETSPAQVIAALTRTTERANAAYEGTRAAVSKVDEVKNLVARLLHGGDPGPLLSMLDNLKQILTQVAQRNSVVKQSLEAAVSEARQIGSPAN
jgi:hypothetical protein